jgi:hypothetical protein
VRTADKPSVSKSDAAKIAKIVKRAVNLTTGSRIPYSALEATEDLTAVHSVTPLDLSRLLEATEQQFIADVFGIRRYIDRKTGRLNGFRPQCVK